MYATLQTPTASHSAHLAHARWAPRAPVEIGPQGNQLLAALPASDWQRWSPQLQLVEMPLGQVLYESGRCLSHVHFPTSSIVSLLHETASGASAEVATVGNDGVVGIPLLTGGMSTNGRAVVQSAGLGYRLNRQVVVDAFNAGGALTQLLLRYTQALLTQVAQTALCNRHHSIEQQVCRLLLLNLDRAQGNCLQMTQERLAGKLGVRRESVTGVALALQREDLIRYARGRIEVLDREGLEERACECYGEVKHECERLLPSGR
ncbi:Crp/Fnr family transcriptional regulator [Hydrogenophaga sp.]|uniref:Crp/Fnr family transcriptional regulator n=1 Tax=Hydrogenophaga sp. TaxID=1904254 RepID=UPI00272F4C51|nr:Crp/Fnr family transcriptional regulator [Hydrogenophaga sp.]MDP1685034.1 Crp/Fnr family transcriptional regulator [Hydrogenophaga sp.]